MRRGLLIILCVIMATAFYQQDSQASFLGTSIRFHPCIRADGLYTLKVEVVEGVGAPLSLKGVLSSVGYNLWGRKDGGAWKYYGQVPVGWVGTFWGLPEGTRYDFMIGGMTMIDPPSLTGITQVINGGGYHSITLEGTDYPHCKTCTGKPLFKMYLLTRPDSYCIIISDLHPSVERQKALCFPGTGWVATSTPCSGYVCDEDCWECDYLGFDRLSLKNLRSIYERHLSQTQ